jgi:hypothetical protein
MKKKLQIVGLFIFYLAFSTHWLQAQNNLVVRFKNGTQSVSLLSTVDRITFSAGSLLLKKTDASTSSLLLSDINRLTFGLYSAINEITADQTGLAIYPSPATHYINLLNAPQGEIVIVIFGLDGTTLMNEKLNSGMRQMDISGLAKGLYLLKVNNTTFKFLKQ